MTHTDPFVAETEALIAIQKDDVAWLDRRVNELQRERTDSARTRDELQHTLALYRDTHGLTPQSPETDPR